MEKKFYQAQIVKADSDEYDATFIMSSASPDRVNDTIDPEAYKPFIGQKLIALWQHNSEKPFGFWDNLRMKGDSLVGDLKSAGTIIGGMVRQLLDADVPLGASIGFRAEKWEHLDNGGIHFKEIELLECSVVSVPAHPLAVQLAKHLEDTKPSNGSGTTASGDVIKRAKQTIIKANKTIRS